ncbi:adenylate kinase [Candidatus Peregrinibacteria bacterium CG11_big_fil_rev_8_21_14_0_20_41_10]|nr:MAG: adenylate kinase [Candidatus Peregrinibacteria bacterium CG11_big_fil_rev_8_21_14_0_20_41_10]PIZ75704.1 MAG: adenylate kinase [Candidatus Peregrinibacteria bacterium CG_4_10_14_0_2_um_filter_41_8]PJC37981.1 MAG: adenylate kinase [Candidatus Peregrinibacteria bacterium CG_4_9_14_0_2_um_filter_41_14]
MDYFFFGIQGSGKGTQTKLLGQNYNIPVFETGHELRTMAMQDTELGRRVKQTIEGGDLVTNEIVMEIVEAFISTNEDAKHLIFDGIPRNKDQQAMLHQLLENHGRDYSAVLITLTKPEAMTRLLKRAEIEGRADDTEEGIEKRINIFFEQTEPLLSHYRQNHQLIEIKGDQTVEAVYTEEVAKLDL